MPEGFPVSEGGGAPFPLDNDARMMILRSCRILDSDDRDPVFDAITQLTQHTHKSDMCLVSLLDTERQWFKSHLGLAAKCTPRSQAFCGYVVLRNEALVVLDAEIDPTFKNNSLVTGAPYIRFYAGAPVVVDGMVLGSLCVLDSHKPRSSFDQAQQDLLASAAQIVAHAIGMHREHVTTARWRCQLRTLIDHTTAPVMGFDEHGFINEWNGTAQRVFGYTEEEVMGKEFSEFLLAEGEHRTEMSRISDEAKAGKSVLAACVMIITKPHHNKQDLKEVKEIVFTAMPRTNGEGKICGVVCVGQNMDRLGDAQPQVPRKSLAQACAVCDPDDRDGH